MDAGGVTAGSEEPVRADRLCNDERAGRSPPERRFPPPLGTDERDRLERAGHDRVGCDEVGNVELCGDRRAVAVVSVEQLQDAGRDAELASTRERRLEAHRVDEPDAPFGGESMRRPRRRLVDDPGEAVGAALVAEANVHRTSVCARGLAPPASAPTSPRGTPGVPGFRLSREPLQECAGFVSTSCQARQRTRLAARWCRPRPSLAVASTRSSRPGSASFIASRNEPTSSRRGGSHPEE